MSYNFFQNKSCEYFPCHKVKDESSFNCLFCYCPLYNHLDCGGNYKMINGKIKDCSLCLIPHQNYDYIINKLQDYNQEKPKGETMIDIYFAKITPEAKIPSKNVEDAGYDIYACFKEEYMEIPPHKTVIIPTGIKSAVDENYYFQIFERGSTGTKGMGQRCGVIDSGYRGEWFIPITNHNSELTIYISKDKDLKKDNALIYPYEKAICQAVVLPVPQTTVHEISVEEIMEIESKRGEGKLGSSKK